MRTRSADRAVRLTPRSRARGGPCGRACTHGGGRPHNVPSACRGPRRARDVSARRLLKRPSCEATQNGGAPPRPVGGGGAPGFVVWSLVTRIAALGAR